MLEFTHIYESVRRSLNLSRDEYALLNYILVLSANPKSGCPGWCDSTLEQKADFIGITSRGISKMQSRLIHDSLMVTNLGFTQVTSKFYDMVTFARKENDRNKVPTSEGTKFRPTRNKVPSKKEQSSDTNNSNKYLLPDGNEFDTKKMATLFDKFLTESGYDCFVWVNQYRHFKSLKIIAECMKATFKVKNEPFPYDEKMSLFFKYGRDYLTKIAASKKSTVEITPAVLANNYNNIIQYATNSKNNNRTASEFANTVASINLD